MSQTNQKNIPKRSIRRAVLPIIDRRFQFKVTVLVVGMVTLVHLVLGGYIYIHVSDFAYKLADFVPDLAEDAAWFRTMLLRYMVVTVISTFLLIIFLSIYFSARISGPLFNMTRVMEEVARGQFSKRVKLRRFDELKEFSDSCNRLFSALEDREDRLQQSLGSLEAKLKGNAEASALLKNAQELAFHEVSEVSEVSEVKAPDNTPRQI